MGVKPKPARVTSTPEARLPVRGKAPKSVGLRETQQALRDTENRFRAFVEQSSDMLSLLDERGTIIYQSKSIIHHLGYEPAETIGVSCFDFVHPEDVETAIAGFRQGLDDPSEGEAITIRLRHKSGCWKSFEAVSSSYVHQGRKAGLLASFRYVGDRLEAELELRRSEERYRRLFERSLAGVFTSQCGRLIDCNDSFAHIFGYESREQMLAAGDFNPYYSAQQRADYIAKLKRERALTNLEFRLRRRDGSEVWVLENVMLEEGGDEAILGTLIDITERKRSERLQSALYSISDCVNSVVDLEQLYPALHKIVGDLMYAKNLYIALLDDSGERLHFAYFVDENNRAPASRRLGKGLTEYVLRSGKPLLAESQKIRELEKQGEIEAIGRNCVDWLGVPLRHGTKVFGVIALQSYDTEIRHTEYDRDILTYVSQHISVALVRKQQEEALRASEARHRSLVESAVYGMYRSSLSSST
jgi:PAS domain S-box-containing protein